MTDSIVIMKIGGAGVRMDYKKSTGSMQDLFREGNMFRAKKGLPLRHVDDYLNQNATREYLKSVESEIGESPITRKRGRNGGTWAHLYVLLDAAAYMDPDFKLRVYKDLVERKLLYWREASSEDFKALNATLKEHAESVLGKPAHHGHHITMSRIIRDRVLGKDHPGWHLADPEQLQDRDRIENALVSAMRAGLVKDWHHLKELAEIV